MTWYIMQSALVSYYIGESGRRIAEREKDHNGRDHKSHILKHLLETGHEHVASSDLNH